MKTTTQKPNQDDEEMLSPRSLEEMDEFKKRIEKVVYQDQDLKVLKNLAKLMNFRYKMLIIQPRYLKLLEKVAELDHKVTSSYSEHLYKSDLSYFGVYWGGNQIDRDEPKNEEGFILQFRNAYDFIKGHTLCPGGYTFTARPQHVQRIIIALAKGERGAHGVVEYTEVEAKEWIEYEKNKPTRKRVKRT